jgi:hypothetical protein
VTLLAAGVVALTGAHADAAGPVVTSISPSSGPEAGGTSVTISGSA